MLDGHLFPQTTGSAKKANTQKTMGKLKDICIWVLGWVTLSSINIKANLGLQKK
jgi:hypothetical protein